MWILTFLIGPIGRYLLIAAAVGGSWLWIKVHYENIGYSKALSHIAAQDLKAKGKSDEAHQTVAACFDGGGSWDVSSGTCVK